MEKALNNSGPAAAKPGHRAKRAEPGRRGAKDALEWLMHTIFLLCGIVAVGFVLVISVYLIISGVPAMKEIGLTDFLLGQTWAPTASDPSYGILPFILTSIYGTAGAVLIGVPIGLMTAITWPRWPIPGWLRSFTRRWSCWRGFPRWFTAWLV